MKKQDPDFDPEFGRRVHMYAITAGLTPGEFVQQVTKRGSSVDEWLERHPSARASARDLKDESSVPAIETGQRLNITNPTLLW